MSLDLLAEPERYANHKDLVKRVLSGEAPAQLPNLLTEYFRLTPILGAETFLTAPMIGSQLKKLLPPSVRWKDVYVDSSLWLPRR